MGTAGNYTAYVVCKCIVGFGLGLLYTSTIPYGIEFMPPHRRGAMTAVFGIGLSLGGTFVSVICYGTSSLQSSWAWKAPIIGEIPLALLYGTVVMLFPDSPRWFILRGRDQHAAEAFLKIYRGHLAISDADAGIRQSIESELELARTTKWTEIFDRRYIPRLWAASFVIVASVLFYVNLYSAIFFGHLHVAQNPFVLTLIIGVCSFAGALVGPWVAEALGRRRAQLTGYAILGSLMLVIGIVNTALGTADHRTVLMLVVLLCFWQCTMTAFIASTAWLLAAEIHSVRLRTMAQAFVMGTCFFFQFGNEFWTQYMLNPDYGHMGVNITYYFFGLSAIFLVLIYLFVPETGQLSLEQIDELIAFDTKPWSTSLKRNRALASGQQPYTAPSK